VPGLVLALEQPGTAWVLLEASVRRAAFLEASIAELDLGSRVSVVTERAERASRQDTMRGAFDLVVARSFGPPAVTAECAAGFLRVGGRLLVSEPPLDVPTTAGRWPAGPLAELGLADRGRAGSVRVLEQVAPAPATAPRRVGMPAKRPLW
jgi:16S rRNA (guanine527-N7)-methyltransferase